MRLIPLIRHRRAPAAHRQRVAPAVAVFFLQQGQAALGSAERRAAFYVLGIGAILFLGLFVLDLLRRPPAVETHWGGFGGGVGGWRISPSLLFLVAAIAFASLATMLMNAEGAGAGGPARRDTTVTSPAAS